MAASFQHSYTDCTTADIHRHLETKRETIIWKAPVCHLTVQAGVWGQVHLQGMRERRASSPACSSRVGILLFSHSKQRQFGGEREPLQGRKSSTVQQSGGPLKDSRQLVLPRASVSPQRRPVMLQASKQHSKVGHLLAVRELFRGVPVRHCDKLGMSMCHPHR